MKTKIFLIFIILLTITQVYAQSSSIQLKKVYFANGSCNYYVPINGSDMLKNRINQERISMMKHIFNNDDFLSWLQGKTINNNVEGNFISDNAKSWTLAKQKADKDCTKEMDMESCKCDFSLNAEHYYQNANVVSISYSYNLYMCSNGTGGAVGEITHTFDKKTGGLILENMLTQDTNNYKRLLVLAEKYFRKQYDIPNQADINNGSNNEFNKFQFDNDKFRLPNNPHNFEFTREGLRFYYDFYEITCGACGKPEFTIPYAELKGVVNYID